jgi:hypothetical protein
MLRAVSGEHVDMRVERGRPALFTWRGETYLVRGAKEYRPAESPEADSALWRVQATGPDGGLGVYELRRVRGAWQLSAAWS